MGSNEVKRLLLEVIEKLDSSEDEGQRPNDFTFNMSRGKTVEETHTRQTWLIRNELIKELDQLATGKNKGFKTQLVNYALEKVIEEVKRGS